MIFMELNGVPYKIIDYYCEQRPGSRLARTLKRCRQYETIAPEEEEDLHPWCTWPTLHRGVDTNQHGILRIGQELSGVNEKFDSTWALLAKAGLKVGVFGPFNSHPLPPDHEHYAFYLPDAFATEAQTWPGSLTPFQEFNLVMTQASGRNVDSGIDVKTALRFLATAPFVGLRPKTALQLATHLLAERREPWKRARRRTYQFVVAFDLFMHQLKRTKPHFCTVFSNHVASSMHRYWAAAFPSEYEQNLYEQDWRERYAGEILFTMDIADDCFSRLVAFSDAHPEYLLVVASSMGQAAHSGVPRTHFATVGDMDRFMEIAGISSQEFELVPAMEPRLGVRVQEDCRANFVGFLKSITVKDESIVVTEKEGNYVSWVIPGVNLKPEEEFARVGGVGMSFEKLGIVNGRVDDQAGSSGYHVPEGSLTIYDPSHAYSDADRPRVSTLDVAPFVLDFFDIENPSYMRGPGPVHLN